MEARMEEAPILVERREGYRVITLNRPRYLNAFTETMHQHLKRVLAEAEDDGDCRALLLTGAGRAFCTGQDLHERVDKDGKAVVLGGALDAYYNPLVRKLRALPFPVVAAVNGVAAGAGANIALACDIVLAARSASFIQAFAKIGLIPDCGGTWLLPRLVGPARARGLALTAEPVTFHRVPSSSRSAASVRNKHRRKQLDMSAGRNADQARARRILEQRSRHAARARARLAARSIARAGAAANPAPASTSARKVLSTFVPAHSVCPLLSFEEGPPPLRS